MVGYDGRVVFAAREKVVAHLFLLWANSYIGTYRVHKEGHLYTVPDPTQAEDVVLFISDQQSPLAWATQEILNFVRVAKRIDYLPTSYLGQGPVSGEQVRPLPA